MKSYYNEKSDEECRGCTIIVCDLDINFYLNGVEYECPCINCLVKAMCENSCDSYTKYVTMFFKNIR